MKSGIDLEGVEEKPRFMGYSVTTGLPTFRYAIGDVVITESIGNDTGKLSIEVKVANAKGAVKYALGDLSKGQFTHSKGKLVYSEVPEFKVELEKIKAHILKLELG